MSEKEGVDVVSLSIDDVVLQYISTLNAIELEILELARAQLESSFDIEKSIGFLNYLKKNDIRVLGG
jgi:hypothetical protein